MPTPHIDGAAVMGKIVFFAPIVVAGCAVPILFIPMYGVIGFAMLAYVVMSWWIVGALSFFVIFLALRSRGKAMMYGLIGVVESLTLGFINLVWFG